MISVNDEEVTPTMFPDKTSQIWNIPSIDSSPKKFNITWLFESEAELFHLQQIVDLIKYARVPCLVNLYIPYLPYGRQDKDISNTTTFALHSFAKIINNMYFDKVETIDAHSNIASTLINNFVSHSPDTSILDTLGCLSVNSIAFPDKGACDRYRDLECLQGCDVIIGHKERCQSTGYITSYNIEGNVKGNNVLMVDDLCDGGMTFKLMADQMIKDGAKDLHLFVSHGIFSKGTQTLRDSGIKRIFTHTGEVI